MQFSPSPQIEFPQSPALHASQSSGHVSQSSSCIGSQAILPQQQPSSGHDSHVSLPLHVPSPQVAQGPQSRSQVSQVSPPASSHVPSPQGQSPQSWGQEEQFSPLPSAHVPSPQPSQTPQSSWQDAHVSVAPSQVPSPQPGHGPQSAGHEVQVSPPAQLPSPHVGADPPVPLLEELGTVPR